jgi:hypothetical protein
MKSIYYHSTLTIGWRIFNHIENSSSPTHDFDECILSSYYDRYFSLYIREKIITDLLSDLKEHVKGNQMFFYYNINMYYFILTQ